MKKRLLHSLETTDIVSQRNNLLKNKSIKEIKKIIRNKIRIKIMGSLIMLYKMPTHFSIAHKKIHASKIRVILMICSDDISDVIAFDYLQIDLKTALSPLIKDVNLIYLYIFFYFEQVLTRTYSTIYLKVCI